MWDLDQLALLERTLAEESRRPDTEGVGIVVFVHGWYHDASVCDRFVACFRALLVVAYTVRLDASGSRP